LEWQDVTGSDADELKELRAWFNENLEKPTSFGRDKLRHTVATNLRLQDFAADLLLSFHRLARHDRTVHPIPSSPCVPAGTLFRSVV
jgi:hypothetical protein